MSLLDSAALLLPVLVWLGASGLEGVGSVLCGGVRLLGLVREGMSVVVCSDFSLLVRLVGWTCRATLTHAWSGAPDLVNKVEPKLR